MSASGLGCRKAFVGPWWVISLLCMTGLRKQSSILVEPPFHTMKLFVVHWLRAVTIENLLMSGCGLSNKSAEDGINGSWVKFERQNPRNV